MVDNGRVSDSSGRKLAGAIEVARSCYLKERRSVHGRCCAALSCGVSMYAAACRVVGAVDVLCRCAQLVHSRAASQSVNRTQAHRLSGCTRAQSSSTTHCWRPPIYSPVDLMRDHSSHPRHLHNCRSDARPFHPSPPLTQLSIWAAELVTLFQANRSELHRW